MESRTLGKTGLTVSRLGIGLVEMGVVEGSDAFQRAEDLLNLALDHGITFLDTAACYARSEEMIGAAVAHRRAEYVLATKAGHVTAAPYTASPDEEAWSQQTIAMSIDRSLERMRTDHLDLVQLHTPPLEILERGEVVTALVRAKEAGKTRFIGYSGDNEEAIHAIDLGVFDTLQTSFNLTDQSARRYLDRAVAAEMGIIIKRPIANMAWTAPQSKVSAPGQYLNRVQEMQAAGALPGEPGDPVRLALGFALAHAQIDTAIVGTANPEHLLENIGLVEAGLKIDDSLVNELHRRFDELGDAWRGQT